MLSSLTAHVRMLEGRDRGLVIEFNREIALDLVQRKQAIAVDNVAAKGALDPWNERQVADYLKHRDGAETKAPNADATEVKARSETGQVSTPAVSPEVSTPRGKKRR